MATFTPGYPIDNRFEEQQLKAASNILGDVEGYAARIVARLTGEETTLQDDNSAPAMPDIRVDYADGRVGYVEVATDIDTQYAQMVSLLRERGGGIPRKLAAPDLNRIWYLTLSGRTNLARLDHRVGGLLAALAAADATVEYPQRALQMAVSSNADIRALHELGVVGLSWSPVKQAEGEAEVGLVQMYPAGTGGPAEVDWDSFLEWINKLVSSKRFVPKCNKLLRIKADERHLFIGTSYSTSWAGFVALTFDCATLPQASPRLPEGITHLWIFNVQCPERCLVWSAEHGWRDTMKHWATD